MNERAATAEDMNADDASSASGPPTPHAPLARASFSPLVYLRAIRPKQWMKNLLLFSGIFLNAYFDRADLWLVSLAGFAIFCLLSGSVYLINDIMDVREDRLHPRKRRRPIAAGLIPIPAAWAYSFALLAASLAGAWFVGHEFFLCAAVYWVLVLAYSLKLKHMVLLDVLVLASGFVLRALAGVIVLRGAMEPGAAPIPVTPWFFVCTLFLALFIALCKRRSEMAALGDHSLQTRAVLRDYPMLLVDQLIGISATCCLVTYALYCTTVAGKEPLVWTLPFVLFGIARYLLHLYRDNEGGAPEQIILSDPALIATVLLWIAAVAAILTGTH